MESRIKRNATVLMPWACDRHAVSPTRGTSKHEKPICQLETRPFMSNGVMVRRKLAGSFSNHSLFILMERNEVGPANWMRNMACFSSPHPKGVPRSEDEVWYIRVLLLTDLLE
ncbi:hypothetical protein llap_15707 [Limosa lapponica baueri]|uniref:Uncharacterized protein n=1 Tax=Limosa lapponica baueri TaxID=1758121 RepID=A0A2I0TJJ6_LIMLA|nr:hypothetical protein llap_15707 [Limosa lapponica baueri]